MSKILVVAAHPDDEVLGLGATIHKLSKTNEVYILIVTEGCSSQYRGQDVAPIIAEKKEMAKKAAEKGYSDAMYNLAKCYHRGKGVKKNDNLALDWFKKCADLGDADAKVMVDQITRELNK